MKNLNQAARLAAAEREPTRRGVPGDYDGSDPDLCNAMTKSGVPCRAIGLENGRCKWHGGKSTGPQTAAGLEAIRRSNAERARARLRMDVEAWLSKAAPVGRS